MHGLRRPLGFCFSNCLPLSPFLPAHSPHSLNFAFSMSCKVDPSCLPSLFLLAESATSLNLERSALARKRFTLQGLSNRRAPPKGKTITTCSVWVASHLSPECCPHSTLCHPSVPCRCGHIPSPPVFHRKQGMPCRQHLTHPALVL